MNYALGCAFNVHDMFTNLNTRKLKIKRKVLEEKFGLTHREELASKIFIESVKIILKDIIENNIMLKLPFGNRGFIKMVAVTGDDFKKAFKRGKFRDIDFIKSFFTGYQMVLTMYTKGYERVKPIYVNKNYKALLAKLTNEGKQYG